MDMWGGRVLRSLVRPLSILAIVFLAGCRASGTLTAGCAGAIGGYRDAFRQLLEGGAWLEDRTVIRCAIAAGDDGILPEILRSLGRTRAMPSEKQALAQAILQVFGEKRISRAWSHLTPDPIAVEGLLAVYRLVPRSAVMQDLVLPLLRSPEEDVRLKALEGLAAADSLPDDYLGAVAGIALAGKEDTLHRILAIRVLSRIASDEVRGVLVQALNDDAVAETAAYALGEGGNQMVLPDLWKRLSGILDKRGASALEATAGEGAREVVFDSVATESDLALIDALADAISALQEPDNDLLLNMLSGTAVQKYAAMRLAAAFRGELRAEVIDRLSRSPGQTEPLTLAAARLLALGVHRPSLAWQSLKAAVATRRPWEVLMLANGFVAGLQRRGPKRDTPENVLQEFVMQQWDAIGMLRPIALEMLAKSNNGQGSDWDPARLLSCADSRTRVWAALSMRSPNRQALAIIEEFLSTAHGSSHADEIAVRRIVEFSPSSVPRILARIEADQCYATRAGALLREASEAHQER
jgi:HEAT repeat protein